MKKKAASRIRLQLSHIFTLKMENICKRIRDASIYTSKKISFKFLFLSDIFLFPFVR